MGSRGPAPTPTVIKKLRGNPGKRRLNDAEPRPGAARLPSAPRWMSEAARGHWRKLSKGLFDCGLLTEVDAPALAMLCETLAQYIEAKRLVQEEGMVATSDQGNVYQHPAVGLMKSSRTDFLRWAREFGMTPASRTRISLDGEGEEESLADILFGNQ